MGIESIAIYSDADRAALHVRRADRAIAIGGTAPADSYLRIDKVVSAAREAGADAIHPGYGFLSENEHFAAACDEAGIVFIGPPAEAMRIMGSKTEARARMKAAGVPVVPGSDGAIADAAGAARVARSIGFPLMLKAAFGGGGRGMRIVRDERDLASAFAAATGEAAAAFGRGDVFIERWIERPRHVEIQVLADAHGSVIHLGERECSIQRRHQKLIEEAPSVAVSPALREEMGRVAVLAAQAAGYVGAGTVEFLLEGAAVAGAGNASAGAGSVNARAGGAAAGSTPSFYFLEMNTRLQVEHPVTELITGLDLVREQVRVASGETLAIAQGDVARRGWAIECRVTAEDPARGFLPSAGRITTLRAPDGPGVRNDGGIYEGYEVPAVYDSLLAKLIVWGADREQAIARLSRALDEYVIAGIATSLPFHRFVVRDEAFRAGDLSTAFVEERWSGAARAAASEAAEPLDETERAAVAAAAALYFATGRGGSSAAAAAGGAAFAGNGARRDGASAWRAAARSAALRRALG
jgi:acetyl-CoA carboxylase biotin carboxylase subunit